MNINSLYGFKDKQSQGYDADGLRVPLTWIRMQPNVVTEVRKHTNSLQVALGKKKNLSKPLQGIVSKITEQKLTPLNFRELKILNTKSQDPNNNQTQNQNDQTEFSIGTKISVADVFAVGDKIKVAGISKGKGFQGVVRRHGFHGGPKTHGQSDRERHPGSIGQGTTPGRVHKGKRMAGHMGSDMITISNLKVFEVKPEEGLLVVTGLIPGGKNTLVQVTKTH